MKQGRVGWEGREREAGGRGSRGTHGSERGEREREGNKDRGGG